MKTVYTCCETTLMSNIFLLLVYRVLWGWCEIFSKRRCCHDGYGAEKVFKFLSFVYCYTYKFAGSVLLIELWFCNFWFLADSSWHKAASLEKFRTEVYSIFACILIQYVWMLFSLLLYVQVLLYAMHDYVTQYHGVDTFNEWCSCCWYSIKYVL